jgi:hypothetical protein
MSSARSIEHTLSPPARRCIRQIHVIPPHFLDAARRPPTPSSSSSSKPPPIRFIFPRKRRNELCSSPALSSSSSPRSVPSLPPSPIAARAAAAVAAAAPPVLPSWSEAAYRVVFWDAENLSIPPDAISQVRRLLDINSPADSDRPLLVQEYRSLSFFFFLSSFSPPRLRSTSAPPSLELTLTDRGRVWNVSGQTMYERGEREKLRSMGIRSVGFRYNGIPGGQQADGEPFCTRLKLFNLFFFPSFLPPPSRLYND